MKQKYLVVMDFPGIKQFVFGTERLVEIRGASALLDKLNRVTIPSLLEKKFGPSKMRCIFVGGGTGQFIIEEEIERIRTVFAEIMGVVFEKTGGAQRLIIGVAALEESFTRSLERAILDLKGEKNRWPFEFCSPVHTGFLRECESCSGMASAISEYAGQSRCLCDACRMKEAWGRDRGLWGDFVAGLNVRGGADANLVEKRRPIDFEEIGNRCRARRGYTALVYGDGNAMGRLVRRIDSGGLYERFSKAVDEAVREACHEALIRHCQPVDEKIPADILLLGGDDLMVYLSADTALPFALEVIRGFESKTKEKLLSDAADPFFRDLLKGRGLTLSVGIAYGRSHTPISIMVDQVEELLKSAKRKGTDRAAGDTVVPACLDFHLTSRFNRVDVEHCRNDHLSYLTAQGENIRLYRGPYTAEEAENLLEHANILKNSGIPNSRLHRLGDAPFFGKVNGSVETLTLYSRCRTSGSGRNGNQRLAIANALAAFGCLSNMPWHEDPDGTTTVLVDLIDIAGFVPSGKEGANDDASSSYSS